MSWSETLRRGRLGLTLTAALGLGGCLQPMYGQTPIVSSTGEVAPNASAEMTTIDVLPMDGRIGQKIRNDLIFAFNGGGTPAKPRYRLDIDVQVISAQVAIVDPFTSRPQLQTAGIDASFVLVDIGKGLPVASGNAMGRATYTRSRQRFASTRAQRDAEDRAAKVIVEQIRAKMMSHFSGLENPTPVKPAGS